MTKVEKGVIGAIIGLALLTVISVSYTFYQIEEAGGMRQVLIEAGREVKSISEEVSKD